MSTPQDVPTVVPQSTPGGATDRQIADLAGQINKPALSFDPARPRKGIVTAIDLGDASSAPTATVFLSGDETVPIAGVRLASDYSPQIGDMVILLQQGVEFFALCSIATVGTITASSTGGGWTKAVLQASHAHNGNANGDLMYRRVMEDGCWKMQWKGSIVFGGSNNTVLLANLPSEFHPAQKKSAICGREVGSGGGVAVGVDFQTDGGVTIIADNWATSTASSHTHSVSGVTDFVDPGDSTTFDSAHSHGVVGGHDHGWGNGTTSAGSHSHTAGDPGWISFSGVEYFL